MGKRGLSLGVILLLLFLIPWFSVHGEEKTGDTLTILFTTDIHSNDVTHKAWDGEKGVNIGGFARLKTMIDQNRVEGETLLLDSGDFSTGTLFQNFTKSDALELCLMNQLGYDAIALGNHDFDVTEEGLRQELEVFRSKTTGTDLICSNLTDGDGRVPQGKEDNPYSAQGVKNYEVYERNGIRIGIFSVMGLDASRYTNLETMSFADYVDTAEYYVKVLREQEKVDLVVLLSHAGTLPDGSFTEDADLAAKVSGIDIILSGHEHIPFEEPIVKNGTIIVCAGTAINNLGKLSLEKEDHKWNYHYELLPATEEYAEDPQIREIMDGYCEELNQGYLKKYGIQEALDDVIAYSPYDFADGDVMCQKCDNYIYATLLSDSFIDALRKVGHDEVQAIAIPVGFVRAGIYKGDISVMDAYNVLSFGDSPCDNSSGAPLVTFYLTGREMYDVCETSISISPIMNTAQILPGGARYYYSNKRPLLNKVYYLEIKDDTTGEYKPVERNEKELYCVASSWKAMESIALVKEASYDLLSIEPKDENGKILETTEDKLSRIVRNSDGMEIKEWYALEQYLADMPIGENGLPTITEVYGKEADYLVKTDRITDFFRNPNKAAKLQYAIFAIALVLFVVIVLVIQRIRKKRWRKKREG